VELYLHSPIRLHGVVLSQAQGQLYLYLYSSLKVRDQVSYPHKQVEKYNSNVLNLACFLYFIRKVKVLIAIYLRAYVCPSTKTFYPSCTFPRNVGTDVEYVGRIVFCNVATTRNLFRYWFR
jgi:hypothetical protein